MNNAIAGVIGIFTAIVTVAIIAVLVSRNSNTAQVIREGASAITGALQIAVSPVTTGGGRAVGRGSNG